MAKKNKELSDIELKAILTNQVRNSIGYLGGELSESRRKSIEYYLGDKLGTEIDGRSQVVSTDVSDTIESILPNLLRVFTASDKVVRCDPVTAEDVALSEQATAYLNHVFYKQNVEKQVPHMVEMVSQKCHLQRLCGKANQLVTQVLDFQII